MCEQSEIFDRYRRTCLGPQTNELRLPLKTVISDGIPYHNNNSIIKIY